mmetsp:Transcript_4749/g.13662  ORF Transcript_4749/g.13662 Transcript_4749/m.13662 type:complete len:204 (+) Transcript_4749:89-700(+)
MASYCHYALRVGACVAGVEGGGVPHCQLAVQRCTGHQCRHRRGKGNRLNRVFMPCHAAQHFARINVAEAHRAILRSRDHSRGAVHCQAGEPCLMKGVAGNGRGAFAGARVPHTQSCITSAAPSDDGAAVRGKCAARHRAAVPCKHLHAGGSVGIPHPGGEVLRPGQQDAPPRVPLQPRHPLVRPFQRVQQSPRRCVPHLDPPI